MRKGACFTYYEVVHCLTYLYTFDVVGYNMASTPRSRLSMIQGCVAHKVGWLQGWYRPSTTHLPYSIAHVNQKVKSTCVLQYIKLYYHTNKETSCVVPSIHNNFSFMNLCCMLIQILANSTQTYSSKIKVTLLEGFCFIEKSNKFKLKQNNIVVIKSSIIFHFFMILYPHDHFTLNTTALTFHIVSV